MPWDAGTEDLTGPGWPHMSDMHPERMVDLGWLTLSGEAMLRALVCQRI